MSEKPKIYIETSVISYLVARPSKDLIVAAHQQITYDWWHDELPKMAPHVSEFVYYEAARGDNNLAQRRLNLIKDFEFIEKNTITEDLADEYLQETKLPEKCRLDCLHMAIASIYGMKYMASWNCKHIVNGVITDKISEVNNSYGISTPNIRTPEELYGVDNG